MTALPLRKLRVSGYRSIRDLPLELEGVTVIVGANGCGKTNLYRSLYLLACAAQGTFARTLAEEGGIPSVLWAGPRNKSPARLDIEVGLEDFNYFISSGPTASPRVDPSAFALDPEVKEERAHLLESRRQHLMLERKGPTATLRDSEGRRIAFPGEIWPSESVLSQISEPQRFPVLAGLKQQFLGWRFYHHFRTDPEAGTRQPQVGVRTPVLSMDGRDLGAALQTILEIGDAPSLNKHLGEAFPGASLEIDIRDGRFMTALALPSLSRPLDARELSDGMLRYLCLLAALLSPRPPPLLVFNEPETSLHPDLLPALAKLFADAGKRSQLIVTTHSRTLADTLCHLSRSAPVHLEKRDGATCVVRKKPDTED